MHYTTLNTNITFLLYGLFIFSTRSDFHSVSDFRLVDLVSILFETMLGFSTSTTKAYHSKILQSIIIVILVFFLKPNIDGATSILGKKNFELHSLRISCPYSTEFILNMTCYVKRINRTSENYAVDIFIKPGVKINSIFVS